MSDKIYCNMTRKERQSAEHVFEVKLRMTEEILAEKHTPEELESVDPIDNDVFEDVSSRLDSGIEAMAEVYDSETTVFYI